MFARSFGTATGATQRLHLSVPATSRALGRLRRAMADPILVRSGRSLAPTPFALRSAPAVRSLLDGARGLLNSDRTVDPAALERSFTVRINDGVSVTLVGELVRLVSAQAPGVTLRFVGEGDEDPASLRDGTVDLDIGVARTIPGRRAGCPSGRTGRRSRHPG